MFAAPRLCRELPTWSLTYALVITMRPRYHRAGKFSKAESIKNEHHGEKSHGSPSIADVHCCNNCQTKAFTTAIQCPPLVTVLVTRAALISSGPAEYSEE